MAALHWFPSGKIATITNDGASPMTQLMVALIDGALAFSATTAIAAVAAYLLTTRLFIKHDSH